MQRCLLQFLFLINLSITVLGQSADIYQITEHADPTFRNTNAIVIFENYLSTHTELEARLLNPAHSSPSQTWSYNTQNYCNREVMRHLIALQIKAMAERGAIDHIETIFDPEYGIGSKNHKDKGTINNPISFWGHPIQIEILGQRSKLNALTVYHAFRQTIKNDLIRYARHQPIEWHKQDSKTKLQDTLEYLNQHHSEKTKALNKALHENGLNLPTLLKRAIETNLLS
tara:strand:- start:4304 stop:4987 length:684 start_codon:yes stop_codon:yes gene_type:complete